MGLFDKFPYSNSHQLNLDWIIKAIKGDLPEGDGEGSPSAYPYSNSHQLNLDWIIRVVKTTIESAVMSINGKTGEVRLTAEDVNALPDTVTTLPNPHKLFFTGATDQVYDGTEPVFVNIPRGGGGAGSVSYESLIEQGTPIGTLTIDDVPKTVIAPEQTSVDGKTGDLTLAGLLSDETNRGVVALDNIANQGADKSGMYLAVDSSGNIVTAPGGGGSSGVASVNGKTGIVTLSADDVGAIPDTTTTLPNPNAITFTGAVSATYDGSNAVTVDIPQGGSGAVNSVNGMTGDVELAYYDVNAIPATDGAVGTDYIANNAVTENKIAPLAVSREIKFTIPVSEWQTNIPGFVWALTTISGLDENGTFIVDLDMPTSTTTENALALYNAWNPFRTTIVNNQVDIIMFGAPPTIELPVKLLNIRK